MKGSVVALGQVNGQRVAARFVDGQLDDLLVDAPEGAAPSPGAIFRAKVGRPMKGQGGIICDLGGGMRGYLRGAKAVRTGQSILVQVTGHAEGGKATPVTPRILFKSRYAIVTPDAPGLNISRAIKDEEERVRLKEIAVDILADCPFGLILRSACEGADEDAIAADIEAMRSTAEAVVADADGVPELLLSAPDAHELAWRDWPHPDVIDDSANALSDHGVHEALDATLSPRCDLDGGAFAWIEPTRALVAVDVNTGRDTSLAAGLKANLALARALPRLLRCRGLGGAITLDLAPMPKKDRKQFEHVVRAAFKADGIETALAGWTPLGHYELQRKRERLPLADILTR